MFLLSSADRFRSARPVLLPVLFVCAFGTPHRACGQFDPVKILAPLKLDLPAVDSAYGEGKTILLTECADPSNYHFPDEDPVYRVDRKSLFGEPFVFADVDAGVSAGVREPRHLRFADWDEATIFKYLQLAPPIFSTADRTPPVSPDEREYLRQGRAKLLEAARALTTRDADRALSLFDEARKLVPLLPRSELLAARLARRIDDARFRRGARQLLDEAAFGDPRSPEPPLESAAVALDEGRLADAVAQIDRCLSRMDLAPRMAWGPSTEKFLRADAHAIEVEIYRRTRHWRLVERAAGDWLAVEPEASRALAALGEAAYGIDSTSPERHQAAFGLLEAAYRSAEARRKNPGDAPEVGPPELQMAELADRHGHQETAAKWREKYRAKYPPASATPTPAASGPPATADLPAPGN